MKSSKYGATVCSIALGMSVVVCCGCGESGPKLHPVTGTVTLEGKPLVNAGVMFFPRGSTPGNACVGMTDADGKYILKPENRGGTGAPAGEFAVTISKMKDPPPVKPGEAPAAETGLEETLSPKYWDSAQTILKATVPEGGETINFQLKRRP